MLDAVRDQLQSALADRYVIERELGHGGMATVYLARDLRHDRLVALKVLRPDLGAALGPERFTREIKLVAGMQHPHAVSVYDSGATPTGQLWFTMLYVEGESLRTRLEREKQLPLDDALKITREVADALERITNPMSAPYRSDARPQPRHPRQQHHGPGKGALTQLRRPIRDLAPHCVLDLFTGIGEAFRQHFGARRRDEHHVLEVEALPVDRKDGFPRQHHARV
jgi:hypothetical protein